MISKLKFSLLFLLIIYFDISYANKSFSDEEKEDLLPVMVEQCFVKHNEADIHSIYKDKDIYVYCECLIKGILDDSDAKETFNEIDKGNISTDIYKNLVNETAIECKSKQPNPIIQ